MAADDVFDEQAMSPIGPKRHFAATQQTVALGCIATVREERFIAINSCTRARYSDTGSISVGSSSVARKVLSLPNIEKLLRELAISFCIHRIDN